MEQFAPSHAKKYLCAASCDGQETRWSATSYSGIVDGIGPAGLSPLQRRRVLAGSDPLLPDLTLTLDLLDDAILILHEDGRIIHGNHAAAALAQPARAHGLSSLYVLPPDEPWVACRQILREHHKQGGWLEREVRDPGTGRSWSLRLSALAYLGVIPRRLVLVIRDITEAVRTRQSLREREVMAATGTLLAGAAHQAKNAIFGLSATLDAFEARIKKDVSQDDYIDNLRLGIARMHTLMRDLLDYSNPTLGESGPVSMAAVVRNAVGGCQSLASKMSVAFALDVAEDAEVTANPARLVRALENLVENAVQHSPQAGTVRLRLSPATVDGRKLIRCDVRDQGPGFPPEHLEKLFTPFFTLRPGGTGLGLAIAKKIVEDLGGATRLSNGTSGGAQATIFLPIAGESGSEFRTGLSEGDGGPKQNSSGR